MCINDLEIFVIVIKEKFPALKDAAKEKVMKAIEKAQTYGELVKKAKAEIFQLIKDFSVNIFDIMKDFRKKVLGQNFLDESLDEDFPSLQQVKEKIQKCKFVNNVVFKNKSNTRW